MSSGRTTYTKITKNEAEEIIKEEYIIIRFRFCSEQTESEIRALLEGYINE